MAVFRKATITVEASKYQEGLEDGFCDGSTTVTSQTKSRCCFNPYIETAQGRKIIRNDDFLILAPAEHRDVLTREQFEKEYKPAERD